MIVGNGIDVVDISRVQKLLAGFEEDYLLGAFTRAERELAQEHSCRVAFLAGRVAAKEAVVKALGIGFSGDVAWQHVEINRLEDGQPSVRLSGAALAEANRLGVVRWFISISHSDSTAVASAIAVGGRLPFTRNLGK